MGHLHTILMARRKKNFSCGHRGYGQTCHRCAKVQLNQLLKKQTKQKWEDTFTQDPINLRHLPKNVVVKARNIMAALREEQNYRSFHGKRLRYDRFIISIPVTRNYRLLCRDYGNLLIPECVVSHEDYNVCKPGS